MADNEMLVCAGCGESEPRSTPFGLRKIKAIHDPAAESDRSLLCRKCHEIAAREFGAQCPVRYNHHRGMVCPVCRRKR